MQIYFDTLRPKFCLYQMDKFNTFQNEKKNSENLLFFLSNISRETANKDTIIVYNQLIWPLWH